MYAGDDFVEPEQALAERPEDCEENVAAPPHKRFLTSGSSRRGGGPCSECGCRETPQWRNGPTGPKTLCNGCGVRWSRRGGQKSSLDLRCSRQPRRVAPLRPPLARRRKAAAKSAGAAAEAEGLCTQPLSGETAAFATSAHGDGNTAAAAASAAEHRYGRWWGQWPLADASRQTPADGQYTRCSHCRLLLQRSFGSLLCGDCLATYNVGLQSCLVRSEQPARALPNAVLPT